MVELLSSPEAWLSLATLATLELVLGVDNIIFITILAARLPAAQRDRARTIGLAGAFVSRLGLLGALSWIMRLDRPMFELGGYGVSGKPLALFAGGLFLLYKATTEIYERLEVSGVGGAPPRGGATLLKVVAQIVVLDMVFSIDSVVTAVGMTDVIAIMVAANLIALAVMLVLSKVIGGFVERHPSVKVLALAFLLMIGLVLVAEAFGAHIPKGYVYGAMGFSIFVELLNLRTARRT